jgi:hypothetical protein
MATLFFSAALGMASFDLDFFLAFFFLAGMVELHQSENEIKNANDKHSKISSI